MYADPRDQLPDDHPCKRAKVLQAALDKLLTGAEEAQVRNGDQWLSFHPTNVKELKAQLISAQRDCRVLCGGSHAYRSTPARLPFGSYGFGPDRYR